MKFHRHSVFFKLHFFFIIAFGVLLLLFYTAYEEQSAQQEALLTHRSMELANTLSKLTNHTCYLQNHQLSSIGFKPITMLDKNAKPLVLSDELKNKLRINQINVTIYEDKEGIVYALQREHCTMFYRDTVEGLTYYFVWILFLALMGGLISIYLLLWRNLSPLKYLYNEIKRYGEGERISLKLSQGHDEIAMISNAFRDALEKQAKLKSSRELFLRNIMHELKTPIMKGKLIVELEEPSANTTLLSKLFSRMEHLIFQMAQIERMHALGLERVSTSPSTLIHMAIERLLADENDIELSGSDEPIVVDPELFTSALQNLIDNALRHATSLPIQIVCGSNSICVKNSGEPLKRPVEEALQAFVTEQGSGGLGLGLYIAQSVCDLHGFSLAYDYEEGTHAFCIRL